MQTFLGYTLSSERPLRTANTTSRQRSYAINERPFQAFFQSPNPNLRQHREKCGLERSACAPFIKERRMESINAANLHRKSGQWGIQPLLLGCESITLDGINERSGQNAFLRSP